LFYVAPLADSYRVAVFDTNGQLMRTFGRRGQGPGEFVEIRDLQKGPEDSLFVLHDERISVFAPHTLGYVRSMSSRAASMARYMAILADGSVATARTSWNDRDPAEDLVWIHPSDGSNPIPAGLVTVDTTSRALVVRNDTIWLLRRDYTLFRKAPGGDWVAVFRRPLWFAEEVRSAAREKRPPPSIADLAIDDDGRIWVLSYWFTELERRQVAAGPERPAGMLSVAEWSSYAHPRLDGWSADGTFAVSVTAPEGLAGFADHRHLVQVAESSIGNPVLTIRRFQVRQ
jgi:hypothetical protein